MWDTRYAVPCVPGEPHGLGHCVQFGPMVTAGHPWGAMMQLREFDYIVLPPVDETCLIDGENGEVFVASTVTGAWYAVLEYLS